MTNDDARERFLSTWGSNCGASREVFAGHLDKLLKAHARDTVEKCLRIVNRHTFTAAALVALRKEFGMEPE